MKPEERAVKVLRDGFGWQQQEIDAAAGQHALRVLAAALHEAEQEAREGQGAAWVDEPAEALMDRLGLLEAAGAEAGALVVQAVRHLSGRLATALVGAILEEREACACIAETLSRKEGEATGGHGARIAVAIRERGRP